MRLRQQLAAYSPVRPTHAFRALAGRPDAKAALLLHLCSEYQAEHVELYGSGTQALQVALTLAMQATGDSRVAFPAFGCYDLASAAIGARATVCLYDLDPDTLAPDLDSFEQSLRAGARIAVVAPLYGMPVPWGDIAALADAYDCLLIEDAAQGFGATWQGRPLGSLGAISVLSFGRGKGWTCGGGGALLLRNGTVRPPSAPMVKRPFRRSAALLVQWALSRPSVYWIPATIPALGLGQTIYHPPLPPTQLGPDGASVLRSSLGAALTEVASRRQHASRLVAALQDAGVEYYHEPSNGVAGWLRLPIRLEGSARRMMLYEGQRLGIAASYPTTLSAVDQLVPQLCSPRTATPGAMSLSQQLLTLPTHSLLSERDIGALLQLVRQAARAV